MAIKIELEPGAAHYNIVCYLCSEKTEKAGHRMVEKTVGSDKKIARMTRADEVQNISNSLEFQHSVQLDN